MEQVLKELEQGLKDGTVSKEDAKMILDDIQRALEIEDDALDVVMKGQMLKTVAALTSLL